MSENLYGLADNPFANIESPAQVGAAPIPQQAGLGQALEQPPANVGPPRTPQEFEERKSGWAQFAEKLQTDPQLQQLLLHTGLRMMQPIAPGQTTAGHVSGAVSEALKTTSEQQLLQREMARKEQVSKAEIERATAQTRAAEQETSQSATLFPDRVQAGKQALATADQAFKVASYQLANLEAQKAAGLTSPEHLLKLEAARVAKEKAEVDLKTAQAGQARAHGRAFDAAADASKTKAAPGVRQTLHVTKADDGSIVSTLLVNGKQMQQVMLPPMPEAAATQAATKQVNAQWKADKKSLPGGWDRTVGNDTATQYAADIEAAAAPLMQYRTQWFDENGKLTKDPDAVVETKQPSAGKPAEGGVEEFKLGRDGVYRANTKADNVVSQEKFIREKDAKGVWVYTPVTGRNALAGKTKTEWEEIDGRPAGSTSKTLKNIDGTMPKGKASPVSIDTGYTARG